MVKLNNKNAKPYIPVFNDEFLKKAEVQEIKNRILEISEDYDLDLSKFKGLEISKRFSAHSGMFVVKYTNYSHTEIEECNIVISYGQYSRSFDDFMRTLNHELAHWVCVQHEFGWGHSKDFGEFCVALDGSLMG